MDEGKLYGHLAGGVGERVALDHGVDDGRDVDVVVCGFTLAGKGVVLARLVAKLLGVGGLVVGYTDVEVFLLVGHIFLLVLGLRIVGAEHISARASVYGLDLALEFAVGVYRCRHYIAFVGFAYELQVYPLLALALAQDARLVDIQRGSERVEEAFLRRGVGIHHLALAHGYSHHKGVELVHAGVGHGQRAGVA